MGKLERRLERLEDAERCWAYQEVQRRLYALSDEQLAWAFFGPNGDEDPAGAPLLVRLAELGLPQELQDVAIGADELEAAGETEEAVRRLSDLFDPVLRRLPELKAIARSQRKDV